jgi:Trypsin-co-occurring domain 1
VRKIDSRSEAGSDGRANVTVQLAVAVLRDGEELVFEQDTPASGAALPVGISDLHGRIDFESAMASLKTAAGRVVETFTSLSPPPETCSISFGIKLNAAAGVILAKAETEANFTVKLSWSNKKV